MVYFVQVKRKGEDVLVLVQTGTKSLIPSHLKTHPFLNADVDSITILSESKKISLDDDVVVLTDLTLKLNSDEDKKETSESRKFLGND